MVVVVAGIVAFAAFQIRESIAAHENPATKSNVEVVPRKYPGLMICPYSRDFKTSIGVCPKWSPDALLQYEPGGMGVLNSNLHSASQRTQTRCPGNHMHTLFPDKTKGDALIFGFIPKGYFSQKVTVKNSAKPTLKCETLEGSECKNSQDAVTFPYLCPSFTPPNVQCTVYDPDYFDTQAKVYGMDPICNPMKEVVGNTLDSLTFSIDFFLNPADVAKMNHPLGPSGYRYSGLIPQPSIPEFDRRDMFKNLPRELFATPSELNIQKGWKVNANFSLFAGVVAVLYDPSMGVPTALDFDNVQSNSMSEDILSSFVLFQTNCDDQYAATNNCPQEKFPPIDMLITSQVDFTFTNKIVPRMINKTTYSTTTQTSTKKSFCLPWNGNGCGNSDVRMAFTSSSTVVTTQIISLSILTTVSIIVSTAGTLWGSQEKIKAAIALVKAKLCPPPPARDATAPHPHFSLAAA
jgi:hypothetical protein